MKIRFAILFFLFIASLGLNAQQQINWVSWEEATEKNKVEPRKIIVDIYTDWCSWCKKMDVATFQDPAIVSYVNEHYYAIKFDAEEKKEITLNGHTYKFVRSGRRGYHELAYEITRGRLKYPSLAFLQEDLKLIQALSGYRGPDQLDVILRFFAENVYKVTPWNVFLKSQTQEQTAMPVGNN